MFRRHLQLVDAHTYVNSQVTADTATVDAGSKVGAAFDWRSMFTYPAGSIISAFSTDQSPISSCNRTLGSAHNVAPSSQGTKLAVQPTVSPTSIVEPVTPTLTTSRSSSSSKSFLPRLFAKFQGNWGTTGSALSQVKRNAPNRLHSRGSNIGAPLKILGRNSKKIVTTSQWIKVKACEFTVPEVILKSSPVKEGGINDTDKTATVANLKNTDVKDKRKAGKVAVVKNKGGKVVGNKATATGTATATATATGTTTGTGTATASSKTTPVIIEQDKNRYQNRHVNIVRADIEIIPSVEIHMHKAKK